MSKINTNKIDNLDPIRATRSGDAKPAGKDKASSIESKNKVGEDKLEFSGRATEAGKLLDSLKELPDVREEKVNALREQIAAGEYNPTSEDIADAILKDES
jgi:negative regulator of flagellin synthesis FlgM